ncbi:MAG: hypothetical protein IPL16_09090 [Ignavibacteria bacterium]|nr:hypothetical protein [Ignavibacteria bacterium]
MKKFLFLLPVLSLSLILFMGQKSQDRPEKWNIDSRMTRMIQQSEYVPLPQNDNVVFSTSTRYISTPNGVYAVSPNFRVHPSAGTQSEVPITRHPSNQLIMLASANTFRGGSTFSTGVYVTTDGGVTWFGSDTLNNGGFSYGDPGPMIDKNGIFLMSYITTTGSMGASYSSNNGINWAPTVTFPGASTSADKNLSGTDDAPSSAYYGRSYTVYTEFAGTYTNRIVSSFTTNGGVSWSTIAPVSPPPSTGHHHQGCDVRIGPNGEVYVVWANCTTNGQNSTEDSLGFAKSLDGGVTWAVSTNSANNMNGIRSASMFNSIRTNGFPRIDVDRTGGARNGWIYVVTAEKTVAPATDVSDVILHRSTNSGSTWTSSRVNQDAAGNGKYQYMPSVRVDEYGGVNINYYDTRNIPTNDSAQIYVSRSIDGGSTWSEILVSDHKFMPKPISGLATGYQGDYIGITSGNGKIWPYWADDITGSYQAWIASIDIGPSITHTPLPNTEQLTGNYAVNCVITPSGSGINPSLTKLYWSRNNPLITDSLLMTNSSGTNWTANIPANGSAATYRYYIKTTDSLYMISTSPSGAPLVLNSFIASTDNTNPVITHTPLGNQAKPYWPSTVGATVTDNLGIDSAWVKWYKNTPTPTKQFKLINTSGSSFSAAFNSINADVVLGDVIYYKIFAQDNSLAHHKDSTALYNFTIIEQTLCEGFTSATFPPDLWTLSPTGSYWTRDAVSSYGIGAGSAKYDFWSSPSGTVESIITLAFGSSVNGDSLKFHNAYAPYTGSTDSLIIESSTNAGTTYSSLVRMYGNTTAIIGNSNTLNTTTALSSAFTPTSSQWLTKTFSLPVGTNMIKFTAKSGFGNNLYIDSICKVAGIPPPPPPVVTSSYDSIVVNMPLGNDSTTRNLLIGNTGGSALNWSLTELTAVFDNIKQQNNFTKEQIAEMVNQTKDGRDKYHGPDVTDGSGGPDVFGYIWKDSDEPGGPAFNWVDISGTGTAITTWTNGTGDDGSVVVALPSPFSYYGNSYSQLKICTNGWVSFDVASTNAAYSNTALPDAVEPNNAIYGFWDDLDVRTSGTIYYYNDAVNNRFIIEYKDVPHYSTGGPYTFEIILNYNGKINIQYLTSLTPLNSATIGNENSASTDGLQMVFNNNYVHDNLAILIEKGGLPWVTENPLAGTVAPSSNQNVDVKFFNNTLAAGTYTGKLRISSNDPVTPAKDVKVRLNVGLAVPSTITMIIQGFYNTGLNKLNLRDTSRVYLRNISSPYSIVDSAKAVIDSVTFAGSFLFVNAPSGTYYLQVKTRNGIETWSKAGGESYTSGSPFSYNFTTAVTQAYNSNLKLVGTKYCNYSGDVNDDRTIDASDLSFVDNASTIGVTGYVPEDLTGDYFVDATDLSIVDNNVGIFAETPPGAGPELNTFIKSKNSLGSKAIKKNNVLRNTDDKKRTNDSNK